MNQVSFSLALDRPASITPRGEDGLSGTDQIFGGSTSTVVLASTSKSRSESSNIASYLFSPSSNAAAGVDATNGGALDALGTALINDLRDSSRSSSAGNRASGEEPRSSSPKPSVSDAATAANAHAGAAASGAIPKSKSFHDGAAPLSTREENEGAFGKPAFLKKIPNFKIPSFKGIKPLHRRSGNSRNEDRFDEMGGGSPMEDNGKFSSCVHVHEWHSLIAAHWKVPVMYRITNLFSLLDIIHNKYKPQFSPSAGDVPGEPEKLIATEDAPPEESSDSILEKYRSQNKSRERDRVNTLVDSSVSEHGMTLTIHMFEWAQFGHSNEI